jgi:hypothetical protein
VLEVVCHLHEAANQGRPRQHKRHAVVSTCEFTGSSQCLRAARQAALESGAVLIHAAANMAHVMFKQRS